jgi:NTE family protein
MITAVVFVYSATMVFCQKPYRVGVVFSGGGAKGYAHVGVLKVLEKAGIRIDYIGGTSMGAIIGGLYASGLSATKLDSILRHTDLEGMLQDQLRRTYQPFFEKEYGEKYAMRLSFDDYKITLPQAISNGQTVFDFLSELTDPVNEITDFSKLPIPFLCVGTDVGNGQQVLLDHGNLARAMRASGSLPGLLAPVEIDKRLLTDGGVVNNFPVREILDKGVDIVIGVNVSSGLYKLDELQSIEKILTQIGSYQMEARTVEQMKLCKLVIHPDIEGYSTTSFSATDSLLGRGERAAMKYWDQLVEIARLQKAAPAPVRELQPLHTNSCPMYINAVHIDSNTVFTDKAMIGKFPVELPGELTFSQFREGINAMYDTDNFKSIDYQFVTSPSNARELFIQPRLRPGYQRSLRVGLHFDNVYKSSLLLNGTFRNILFKNSVASLDCIIGDKFRYNFHYFVDRGFKPGFGLNSRLNFTDLSFPVKIDVGNTLQVEKLLFNLSDFTQDVYVSFITRSHFTAGLATELKFFKTSTDQLVNFQTNDNYVNERGWYVSGKAYFHYDTRDHIPFSHRGTLMSIELRATTPLESRKYDEANQKTGWNFDFRYFKAVPLSSRLTTLLSANLGITQGTPAPPFRYFLGSNNQNLINNFIPFIGLPFAKVSGNNLIKTDLAFQYRTLKNQYLTLGGHLAWLDDGLKPFSSGDHLFRSLGLGYGLDTPLGPVELTYSISEHNGSIVYFNLGYWF